MSINAPKDFYIKKFDLLAKVCESLASAQHYTHLLQGHERTAPGETYVDRVDLDTIAGEIHNTALFVTFLKIATSPMAEMCEPVRMTSSQIHEAMGSSIM